MKQDQNIRKKQRNTYHGYMQVYNFMFIHFNFRRYMAEILSIRRKTLSNQSITIGVAYIEATEAVASVKKKKNKKKIK